MSELIMSSLIKFMNSPFTSVRLFIATNINTVVCNETSNEVFQQITSKTFDTLKIIVSIIYEINEFINIMVFNTFKG